MGVTPNSDAIELHGFQEPEARDFDANKDTTIFFGASATISRVICLTEQNLVVAASHDSLVRVYDADTPTEPRLVFEMHTDSVYDVVELEYDVVASVGCDQQLFSWRPSTAEVVGEWRHRRPMTAVAKVGVDKVVVSDYGGRLTALGHKSGSSFMFIGRLKPADFCEATEKDFTKNGVDEESLHFGAPGIALHRGLMVSYSFEPMALLWSAKTFEHLHTLYPGGRVMSAAICKRHIVLACSDGHIYVYRNFSRYSLDFYTRLSYLPISAVAFLNDHVIAVGALNANYFVSLSNRSILSKTSKLDHNPSFTALRDGRFASSVDDVYCGIFVPPEPVWASVGSIAPPASPTSVAGIVKVKPSRAPVRRATQGNELVMWKSFGICNETVRLLKSVEVAACLAAYLVNYEYDRMGQFELYKDLFELHFGECNVFGDTFADADAEDRKSLPDQVMVGLMGVTNEKSWTLRRIRIKNFVRLASS